MNIKKIILITLVLLLSASLLTAAYTKKKAPLRRKTTETFTKGDIFVTPQIGINGGAIPFGANVEFAITENIGIGGSVMLWFWSYGGFSSTGIVPSAEVAYHFTQLEVDKLDVSAGGGFGYFIFSSTLGTGTSSIYPYIFVNGRYYFKPNMAVNLRVPIAFGTWGEAGVCLGVTFRF